MQITTLKPLFALMVAAALTMTFVAGCQEEGPAERAGEAIDEAADNVRDAGKDLGNQIEDACEDVKEGVGAEDTDC